MGGDKRPRGGQRFAVLIAGPTASGKSALALEIARALEGTVINADSMQIYAELRILTNRPTPGEEAAAPHRLYGYRTAREPYSAALWLKDAEVALDKTIEAGRLPILVGGTGLYFTALTEGLSRIPDIPPEIRAKYRLAAENEPPEKLHALLARQDPLTASRLQPSDPQRIARALEVWEATARPLAEWQAEKAPALLPLEQTAAAALIPEREGLYRACDARFDTMLSRGALDEACAMAALALDPSLPAMRAVGLPPLLAYLRGEATMEQAASLAKTQTRNYAKRQLTWIRRNFVAWNIVSKKESERTKQDLIDLIRKRLTRG